MRKALKGIFHQKEYKLFTTHKHTFLYFWMNYTFKNRSSSLNYSEKCIKTFGD